jgi:hypothetical protein
MCGAMSMAKRIDWRKAKTFRQAEVKFDDGHAFDNGVVVRHAPRDSLEARAKAAELRWLKKMKIGKL